MTLFTIRIELRNATQKDQVRMHRRLRNLGITDVIAPHSRPRHKALADPYADTGEVTQYPSLQTAIGCDAECVGTYAMLATDADARQRHRRPGPRKPSLEGRRRESWRPKALPETSSYDFSDHMNQPPGVWHLIGALAVLLAIGVAALAVS